MGARFLGGQLVAGFFTSMQEGPDTATGGNGAHRTVEGPPSPPVAGGASAVQAMAVPGALQPLVLHLHRPWPDIALSRRQRLRRVGDRVRSFGREYFQREALCVDPNGAKRTPKRSGVFPPVIEVVLQPFQGRACLQRLMQPMGGPRCQRRLSSTPAHRPLRKA